MNMSSALFAQVEKLYHAACAERQIAVNKSFHNKEDGELAAQANFHLGVVSGIQQLLDALLIKVKERPVEIDYVNWDESYSNGIERFDNQHKGLFKLISKLHDGILENKNREALGMALDGLIEYTKAHFTDEENAMLAAKYSGFARHKNQHVEFIVQVGDIDRRFQNGDPVMTMELVGFLLRWLKNHIQTVDRAYGPHLKTNGINS